MRSIWSPAIVYCAIALCLHRWLSSAQLLYSPPSSIQYKPLISVPAFPQNESDPAPPPSTTNRVYQGWTPVRNGNANSAPVALNSVYTAINPPVASAVPLASGSTNSNKYAVPVAASLAMSQSVVSPTNPNSTYVFSESIARNSYQKPQSTYMIQPAKYRAAFPSARNATSKGGKSSGTTRKNAKGKLINSEVMPIPMIKPHRHGATLGFNLPDQGLTLYLDINELATKPMAQNIGLKVVSHGKDGEEDDEDALNEVKPLKSSESNSAKSLRKRVTKVIKKIKDSSKNVTVVTAAKSTTAKSLRLQNSERTPTTTVLPPVSSSVGSTKKIKYATKTKSGSGSGNKLTIPSPAQVNKAKQVFEIPSLNHEVNINPNKLFDEANKAGQNLTRNDIPPTASRIPATYVSQRKEGERASVEEEEEANDDSSPDLIKEAGPTAVAPGETERTDEIEREKRPVSTSSSEEAEEDNEADNETDSGGENVERSVNADEELDAVDEAEEPEDDLETTTTTASVDVDGGGGLTTTAPTIVTSSPVEEALRVTTTILSLSENELEPVTTKAPAVVNATIVKRQEVVDNQFVASMQSLIEKSAQLVDISSQTCSAAVSRCKRNSCEPNFKSLTADSATTVREIAQQLEANLILNEVANSFESELQDSMDFSTRGYTIILPSNSAVRRLPPSLLRRWKETGGGLVLDVYVLEGAQTLESLATQKVVETRGKVKLHIGNPHNETFTINGQRVVHANQKAPSGGLVHVIDGLLYPHSDKDIIDTLKSCGRLDGFVTLAEGTGFAQTLKKEGPFTVFVPSNDALQKVPDNDLELIRRNMTALREFLKYHVAQGIHYSQDLIDGQFLPSLLDGEYLQAGVRVDGCSRRLVEVNVSPLYRADIPASNGVIHVVDWILKPDDRDWCNGVILPRRR